MPCSSRNYRTDFVFNWLNKCFVEHPLWASMLAQQVKNLPAVQETQEPRFNPWVGVIPWRKAWKLTLVIAWKIPWGEEPGRLQSTGSQRVGHKWVTKHKQIYQCEALEHHHGQDGGDPCPHGAGDLVIATRKKSWSVAGRLGLGKGEQIMETVSHW